MSEIIQKSGENWLVLRLVPHKGGLLIDVKAHPLIEDLMKGHSGGRTQGLGELGRYNGWEAPPDGAPLSYYRNDALLRADPRSYQLNSVGTNIVTEDELVNLSFLSLVGISEGVRFISTKETYPLDYRRQLKTKIGNAFREFVREYIRPITITLVMSSQEL